MNAYAKSGAFFDLDGTLIATPSLEWRFFAHLLECDEISSANLTRWLWRCAKKILLDRCAAIEANKLYLAGLRETLAAEWTHADASNSPPVLREGIARLAWHRAEGHPIFIVTGTLAPLARAITQNFPCPVEVIASELDTIHGHWTGWLAGEHMSGAAKARALRSLARQHDLDLSRSYAYGNHTADLPMLEAVGNPTTINPSHRLARVARARGWGICHWSKSQRRAHTSRTNLLAPTEAR
jgi:HAD superfamily hydrolase (TIGR01490 family)